MSGSGLRVAMIIQGYAPRLGGAERQLQALAPLLVERGVEVHVLTRLYPGLQAYEEIDGIPVHRLPAPGPKASAALIFSMAALRLLKRLQPQVIHAHELLSPTSTALLARRLWGTPVVAKVLRGGYLGDIGKLKRKPFGQQRLHSLRDGVDMFIAISQEIDAELAEMGVPSERRCFQPNGVDRARFHPLLGGLNSYFSQRGAAAFLLFIVLYKLGDAFAGSLMTAFLLKSMAYTSAEVGVVNKVIGLWLTIGGALVGGALMLKLGLWRALVFYGVLQMVSNLGFWWLAVSGKGVIPGTVLPAFDWGFVALAAPTPVDGGLLLVVAFENLSGGMGTAAFVAFLMSLCNQRFTATQYALLSAFASVGRVWVGPLAGVLAESIGWPAFFIVSTVVAVPALVMLWWLRAPVRALEVDPAMAGRADD